MPGQIPHPPNNAHRAQSASERRRAALRVRGLSGPSTTRLELACAVLIIPRQDLPSLRATRNLIQSTLTVDDGKTCWSVDCPHQCAVCARCNRINTNAHWHHCNCGQRGALMMPHTVTPCQGQRRRHKWRSPSLHCPSPAQPPRLRGRRHASACCAALRRTPQAP